MSTLLCVECGEEAIAISGGDSYCQYHLEINKRIWWGKKAEEENTKKSE